MQVQKNKFFKIAIFIFGVFVFFSIFPSYSAAELDGNGNGCKGLGFYWGFYKCDPITGKIYNCFTDLNGEYKGCSYCFFEKFICNKIKTYNCDKTTKACVEAEPGKIGEYPNSYCNWACKEPPPQPQLGCYNGMCRYMKAGDPKPSNVSCSVPTSGISTQCYACSTENGQCLSKESLPFGMTLSGPNCDPNTPDYPTNNPIGWSACMKSVCDGLRCATVPKDSSIGSGPCNPQNGDNDCSKVGCLDKKCSRVEKDATVDAPCGETYTDPETGNQYQNLACSKQWRCSGTACIYTDQTRDSNGVMEPCGNKDSSGYPSGGGNNSVCQPTPKSHCNSDGTCVAPSDPASIWANGDECDNENPCDSCDDALGVCQQSGETCEDNEDCNPQCELGPSGTTKICSNGQGGCIDADDCTNNCDVVNCEKWNRELQECVANCPCGCGSNDIAYMPTEAVAAFGFYNKLAAKPFPIPGQCKPNPECEPACQDNETCSCGSCQPIEPPCVHESWTQCSWACGTSDSGMPMKVCEQIDNCNAERKQTQVCTGGNSSIGGTACAMALRCCNPAFDPNCDPGAEDACQWEEDAGVGLQKWITEPYCDGDTCMVSEPVSEIMSGAACPADQNVTLGCSPPAANGLCYCLNWESAGKCTTANPDRTIGFPHCDIKTTTTSQGCSATGGTGGGDYGGTTCETGETEPCPCDQANIQTCTANGTWDRSQCTSNPGCGLVDNQWACTCVQGQGDACLDCQCMPGETRDCQGDCGTSTCDETGRWGPCSSHWECDATGGAGVCGCESGEGENECTGTDDGGRCDGSTCPAGQHLGVVNCMCQCTDSSTAPICEYPGPDPSCSGVICDSVSSKCVSGDPTTGKQCSLDSIPGDACAPFGKHKECDINGDGCLVIDEEDIDDCLSDSECPACAEDDTRTKDCDVCGATRTISQTCVSGAWDPACSAVYYSCSNTGVCECREGDLVSSCNFGQACTPNQPPIAETLSVSPVSSSQSDYCSSHAATFRWNYSDPESDGEGGFKLQISSQVFPSTGDNCPNCEINIAAPGLTTSEHSYSYPVQITAGAGHLAYNTSYYWRVKEQDSRGNWSNWINYTSRRTNTYTYPYKHPAPVFSFTSTSKPPVGNDYGYTFSDDPASTCYTLEYNGTGIYGPINCSDLKTSGEGNGVCSLVGAWSGYCEGRFPGTACWTWYLTWPGQEVSTIQCGKPDASYTYTKGDYTVAREICDDIGCCTVTNDIRPGMSVNLPWWKEISPFNNTGP